MSSAGAGRTTIGAVAIVLAYVAGLNLAWQPVQIRVWNYFNWIDILVMSILIAPFLASRWIWPSVTRATRIAWWLAAIMAVDVLFFTITAIGLPGSGHPSLESLVLYFSAMAKIAMVPAALIALCVAFSKGERVIVVALGVICLICQSVYSVPGPEHPFRWLLVRYWLTGDVS